MNCGYHSVIRTCHSKAETTTIIYGAGWHSRNALYTWPIARIVPWLDQDCFLPNLIQYFIHHFFYCNQKNKQTTLWSVYVFTGCWNAKSILLKKQDNSLVLSIERTAQRHWSCSRRNFATLKNTLLEWYTINYWIRYVCAVQ